MLGDPDGAPYDRILVSAEPDELPEELVDQLADDGILVIPVAGTMLRVSQPGRGRDAARALPVRAPALRRQGRATCSARLAGAWMQ